MSFSIYPKIHLKIYSFIPFFVALIIPLTLTIVWHYVNTVLPNSDAAEYLITAHQIYEKFKTVNLWEGIRAIYEIRGWRPIFFPVCILPFLFISGGKALLTVGLTMSTVFLMMLTYAYFLCREIVSPWRSALCVIFLGTITWVVEFTHVLMSELLLVVCGLAVIYHLKKCTFFTVKKHAIACALAFALGLVVRPVEMSLAFFPLLGAVVIICLKKKTLTWNDVLLITPFGLVVILMLYISMRGWIPTDYTSFIGLGVVLLMAGLAMIGYRRWKILNRIFGLSFFISLLLTFLWWFPGMERFYQWIHLTTGFVAQHYHDQGQMSVFQAITAFFVRLGGIPLFIMFLLSLITVMTSTKSNQNLLKQYLIYSCIAITVLIFPIIALALTPDIAYRRAFIGFTILILVQSVFAAHPSGVWRSLRLCLLTIVCVLQLGIISLFAFDLQLPLREKMKPFLYDIRPPLVGGDPSTKTFEKLLEFPIKGAHISTHTLAMNQFFERPFNAAALNLVNELHSNVFIPMGYPGGFVQLEEAYRQLRENWDYALVDVTTDPPSNPIHSESPLNQFSEDLIARWKKGTLAEVGLKPVREMTISIPYPKNSGTPKEKRIILLMTEGVGRQKLTFDENLALQSHGVEAGANLPSEKGFPLKHLNDGLDWTAWGAVGSTKDTVVYVELPEAIMVKYLQLSLFSTPNGGHIRDVAVVGSHHVGPKEKNWVILRSRMTKNDAFNDKITIPDLPNRSIIRLEIDPQDRLPFKVYGLACYSESKGYLRNYLGEGRSGGIYLNEMQLTNKKMAIN